MTQLSYIRLLKLPPNVIVPGKPFNIAWTIANDLGEIPFWEPLTVMCHLLGDNACFAGSKRSIQLEYDPYKGGGTVRSSLTITGSIQNTQPLQLVLTCNRTAAGSATHPVWHLARQADSDTWIIPVWSQPMRLGNAGDSDTTRECERQVIGPNNSIIKIRESTGQSMAHHVWDCGLWLCQYLAHYVPTKRYNRVLELGSGTAIAGIYTAHALSPARVYLTDLPDAVPDIENNVRLQHWTKGQDVVAEALEWGMDQHQPLDNEGCIDLVLLTDLVYNRSSHDVLIETLVALMEQNPGLQILLAYKPRCPVDERVFFDQIRLLGWRCTMDSQTTECAPCEVYWIEAE